MKKIFVAVLFIIFSGLYLFFPMSNDAAMKRAQNEFSYVCTDMHWDCSIFKENGQVEDKNNVRIYQWSDIEDRTSVFYVRVPHQRIGDVTSGLIGADVTSGSDISKMTLKKIDKGSP